MSFQRPGAGLDLFFGKMIRTLAGKINRTKQGLKGDIRKGDAAAVDRAVEQSTELLEAHAALVAAVDQLGHILEGGDLDIDGAGIATLKALIARGTDFTSALRSALRGTTSHTGSAGVIGEAGTDGTGVVGTGQAAGLYGEASGTSGVGAAGKSSSTNAAAVAVAALLNAGAAGDLFRGLLDLDTVFRVRFDGSTVIGGALSLPVRTVTADASAAAADHLLLVGTRAAGVTITLPDAADHPGRQIVVKDSSGQAATWAITVESAVGDIDGAGVDTISTDYGSRRYASDGSDWFTW